MASQIDFDRNAEQLPIELASVVGTAARAAHVVCVIASDESKLGRPADMQTAASPTSKSNGDISPVSGCTRNTLSVLSAWRVRASLSSCSQPKLRTQDAL
jgi:hypothetical protein